MILLPKYCLKDEHIMINPSQPMARVAGQIKAVLCDLNDRVVYESPWSSNRILDSGLDQIAERIQNYGIIGDSDIAINDTQTALGNQTQATTSGANTSDSNYATGPLWALDHTKVHYFAAGTATTVKEFAVCGFQQQLDIYNRHLVSPWIPKSIDNILYMYMKHIVYPNLIDNTVIGTTIAGETFDVICRAMDVDRAIYNGSAESMTITTLGTGSSYQRHYPGDIGAITDIPAGSGETNYSTSSGAQAYGTGNHYRDWDFYAAINRANVPGGFLRSMMVPYTGSPMQIQFNATSGPDIGKGIPKDDTKELNWTLRLNWDRYVP